MRPVPLFFWIFFATQFTFAQNAFQKAFYSKSKSTKENIRIGFIDDLGNSGHLPICIINGKTLGPVFTIIAGVHGYEYPPIIATQKILKEINPEELKGTLIIIPIANMASFFTRTPFINPQDQKNLNNAFPGKKEGSITEQMALFITNQSKPLWQKNFLKIADFNMSSPIHIPFQKQNRQNTPLNKLFRTEKRH